MYTLLKVKQDQGLWQFHTLYLIILQIVDIIYLSNLIRTAPVRVRPGKKR